MVSHSQQILLFLGSFLGFLGVLAGAFGAHFLKQRLSVESLVIYETAVRYQLYHALILIIIGISLYLFSSPWLVISGSFFLSGILVFSGSLYLLVFSDIKAWGMITPIGGVLLLLGWLSLCGAALTLRHLS